MINNMNFATVIHRQVCYAFKFIIMPANLTVIQIDLPNF